MAFLRASRPDKASGLQMLIVYACAGVISVGVLLAIGWMVADVIALVIR